MPEPLPNSGDVGHQHGGQPSQQPLFERESVSSALNWAVDFVLDRANDKTDDDRLSDAANLIVNLCMGRLDDPNADPRQIIGEAYSEDPDEVLSWL